MTVKMKRRKFTSHSSISALAEYEKIYLATITLTQKIQYILKIYVHMYEKNGNKILWWQEMSMLTLQTCML